MEGGLSFLLASGALIVALTVLGLVVVQFLGRRALGFIHSLTHLREARRQQLVTLVQISRWSIDLLIAVSALLMLLATFGVDITPLLASVGVAGLAVSLGAQSLIKDLIGRGGRCIRHGGADHVARHLPAGHQWASAHHP